MATIPEIRSEETKSTSWKSQKTMSFKKLSDENIIFDTQIHIITDPIGPKCISKESMRSKLTMSSAIKAGLVFFATVGGYYLTKATGLFSSFRRGVKSSKDVSNSEIVEVKNALSARRTSKMNGQISNPFINHVVSDYKGKDSTVKFKETKIEEFKNSLNAKKEKNVETRESVSRRSISIENPIPDQNTIVGKSFELTIDGTSVFSSSGAIYLEATNIPAWLNFLLLNPNPTFKGSYSTPHNRAVGVAVSGNYACIVDGKSGLQIIDISDPSNPTFKGSYNTPEQVMGVALSGNYAYVASHISGLQIIDISDPSNPTFKGSCDEMLGRAWEVTIFNNYAYVTSLGDFDSYLRIIAITDPANPTFISAYNTFDITTGKVVISSNYAYMANRPGLEIIDISNPLNPTFKGSYSTPNWAWAVAISGNYAYVTAGGYNDTSGLHIIDISDTSNPTFKSSYRMPDKAYGVALSGNYAYVANRHSGLQIIDISDPSNPTFECSYDTLGGVGRVVVSGNYAYVTNTGLQIIALNPNKLILSGASMSEGTYSVDIKACNEILECVTDSFNIIVKNSFLTTSSIIISSMTVGVCLACVASFCLPLTIGGGILMLRRRRSKILENKSNIGTKELKAENELQKMDISNNKKQEE
jgi:hypothetical protein